MLIKYFTFLRWLKKKKFNRHTSLGDLIFSRSNTAEFYGFGAGTTCYNNVLILGDVTVGKNCWIGPNVILDGSGGLTLGDNCTISAGVHLYTHNSIDMKNIKRQSTNVGNNVYIGPNSVIQMGVEIGDNTLIGALSLVNKSIPSSNKAWGAPAKVYTKRLIKDNV